MQKHIMCFNDFVDKHSSQEWVKKHIERDREDDCLGDLQYVFYTGYELPRNQVTLLREHCMFLSYKVSNEWEIDEKMSELAELSVELRKLFN